MILIKFYSNLCKNLPKIKRIDLNHKNDYFDKYLLDDLGISYSQTFLSSILISTLFTVICLPISLFINIILSGIVLIVAILIYKFFIVFYKRYYSRTANEIDKTQFLIKNFLELYLNMLPSDYDYATLLIKIISEISSPLEEDFRNLFRMVQLGSDPVNLLSNYNSCSENFNKFLRDLLKSDFHKAYLTDESNEYLQSAFKKYTLSIESRVSIYFFIGIFFPLGLNFAFLLNQINLGFFLFGLPVYSLILNYSCKNFLNKNSYLFGVDSQKSDISREEYNHHLDFFTNISYNLSLWNPEQSIYKSIKCADQYLKIRFNTVFQKFMKYELSLGDLLNEIEKKIKDNQTRFLFQNMKIMIITDSYSSANQIQKIIETLKKHKKLEIEKATIIKGNQFRVKIFQIILPLIISLFTGIYPVMFEILQNYNAELVLDISFIAISISLLEIILIFLSNFYLVIITVVYFNKSVSLKIQSKDIILIFLIYIVAFIGTITISQNMVVMSFF